MTSQNVPVDGETRPLLPPSANPDGPEEIAARRGVMSVCTNASREELAGIVVAIAPSLEVADLRPIESGLVMLRGRMGGDGRAFNLGEASVTRAAVALPD